MTRTAWLLGWPLRPWVLPASAVVAAVLSWVVTLRLLSAPYQLWATTSSVWHEALWTTAPVSAGMAALCATLLVQRGSAVFQSTRVRVGLPALTRAALACSGWAVLGHLVGVAPLTIATVSTATTGGPRVQDLALAVVGMGALTVLGFGIGVVARHWAVAPVVAAALFGILALPHGSDFRPVALLMPVQQWPASPRFVLTPWTTLFTLTFLILLACWALAVAASRSGRPRDGGARWLTVAVVVLVVAAFGWRPEFYRVDEPVPSICDQAAGARVCLHTAYSHSLPEVSETVRALQESGTSPVLTRVTDTAVADHLEPATGEALIAIDPVPERPNFVTQGIADQVALAVTEQLFEEPCSRVGASVVSYDVLRALQVAVLERSGRTGLSARLGSPGDAEALRLLTAPGSVEAVVSTYPAEIAACRLQVSDIEAVTGTPAP